MMLRHADKFFPQSHLSRPWGGAKGKRFWQNGPKSKGLCEIPLGNFKRSNQHPHILDR